MGELIIDTVKKNFRDVGHMLFMSVFFTLMSYQFTRFPYSEPWVDYLFYFGTVVAYLGLIYAIYMKIRDKRNRKTMQ